MSGIIGSKLNHRGSGPVAKLGTDGQHLLSSGAGKSANYETVASATYDDDKLQSNIALLGFKTAVNGSLAKYNLQDQIIDEYEDATGIDAGASTNEALSNGVYFGGTVPTITQDADATGTDGLYTWYKWTDTAATGSYDISVTTDHEWLVVAGGGAGGNGNTGSSYAGGGGGAGGYRTGASLSLTGGNTYTVTVGAGGTPAVLDSASGAAGDGGDSILSGTGITTITSTGGGGGGVRNGLPQTGADGGSGSGGAGISPSEDATAGSATSITPISGETTTIQGNDGGDGIPTGDTGSGGGHGAAGTSTGTYAGAVGGVGTANDIIETGTDVYYAGGGGSGSSSDNTTQAAGGNGGGGNGGQAEQDDATAGTANTGGGGGAGGEANAGKTGGSGIVILRRLTLAGTSAGSDLTLQSTDTTAMAEADNADMVMLMENGAGTATLNTDVKGYVSRDSGTTFTQGTLVDEGTWGTNKKILAFHDLDISGQPSGTDMCYKITTHNQSAGSKETKIHATSIGWKA